MKWKLFANLAETAGEKEVEVDPDGDTVRDAFDALLDEHPELESEVLDEDGELREHIRVLHGGENPFVAGDGWETRVGPDEDLALFPPVSGG